MFEETVRKFEDIDTNGNGQLDQQELTAFLNENPDDIYVKEFKIKDHDEDGDGQINLMEFIYANFKMKEAALVNKK